MSGTCHGCGKALAPSRGPVPRKWCSERCRKVTLYSRPCVDCGATINTDGRTTNPRERCNRCAGIHKTKWTREAIVAAIQRWAAEHESPPSARDWNTTMARADGRPERGTEYPNTDTVQRAFGSWNAGIEASGFASLPRGQRERVAA